MNRVSYRDYKRTQQGVSNIFLYYKHIINIYYDIILSALLLDYRPMTSCHLTSHVTMVTYFFIVQEIK